MKFRRSEPTVHHVVGNIDVFAYPEIRGWIAVRQDERVLGDRSVTLESNGIIIDETVADEARPDVGAAIGPERVGFHFVLDGDDLSQFAGANLRIRDVESGEFLPDETLVLPKVRVGRILVDVGDSLFYFSNHPSASGIQRVVTEVLKATENLSDVEYELVACDPRGTGVHPLDKRAWQSLMNALSRQPDAVQHRAEHALASAMQTRPLDPGTGDVLLLLGAPWISESYLQSVVRFRQRGGRVVFMLYDLIPLRLSHMFDETSLRLFSRVLLTLALLADEALAISDFTRRDFESYCAEYGLVAPPTSVTRLASAFNDNDSKADYSAKRHAGLNIRGKYVLLVSTIEGRKGHALALRAWSKLIRELGEEKVPSLIFVGRPGWHAQDVFSELLRTGNLNGKVQVLSDVDDQLLRELYKGAEFTIYPSTFEGWGLPVGESLAMGTPVIASDSTSIPEVGGDFVNYFRSGDEAGFFAAVKSWVEGEHELNQVRKRVRAGFKPDTWEGIASVVVTAAQRVARRPALSRFAASIPAGAEVLFGSSGDSPSGGADFVEAMWAEEARLTPIMHSVRHVASEPIGELVLHSATHAPDATGRWSRGEETVRLRFDIGAIQDAVVYLDVSSGDSEEPVLASIHGDCLAQSAWIVGDSLIKVVVRPDADNQVSLDIDIRRMRPIEDARGELGIHLRSMLVLRADDLAGQMRVVESRAGVKGHQSLWQA